MFSVPHLIVLFIVALIVFGPEKLPELARNLGKWTAEFKRVTGDMRSTLDEHMRELEREANERKISAPVAPKATDAASPAATPADTSASTDGAESPANGAPSAASSGEAVLTPEAAEKNAVPAPGTVATDSPYLTRSAGATPTAATAAEPNGNSSVNQGATPVTPHTEQPTEVLNETLEPDSPTAKR